jgi:hypothetical protein
VKFQKSKGKFPKNFKISPPIMASGLKIGLRVPKMETEDLVSNGL